MAKGHKPVAGSRGFWPKKRAKRIYPRINAKENSEVKPLIFATYKVGMTSVKLTNTRKASPTQGKEITKAATVLESPPITVCGIKIYKKTLEGFKTLDVIWSENVSKDLPRKTKIPKKSDTKEKIEKFNKLFSDSNNDETIYDIRFMAHTQPRKSGLGKKKPELFEVRIGGKPKEKWEYAKQKLGTEIKLGEVFEEGEMIDAVAISKGKGFQGPVKRFGVTIRGRKHEKKRRHIGNIGSVGVARVLPGKIAMPGQLGFQKRTEYNKKILKIGDKLNIKGGWINYGLVQDECVVIEGSVPGPKKRLIMLRKGMRAPEKKEHVEVKDVYLESQQGV